MRKKFLPFARPDLDESEIAAVTDVLKSGWITTGAKTAKFEEEFKDYVGASFALAVNSCTAALHLALEAMGVGEGDEVITSPYTFAATAEVVRYLRATPIFVDVDRGTLNLDPALVESAITARTKVLLPVHIAGQPAQLDSLLQIASERGLAVLEDCAHALPAWYKGRPLGGDLDKSSYGGIPAHAACFSFYATKTMTTGEGGMLCTSDAELADRARVMSLHGMSHDAWRRYSRTGSWYYEIVAPGFKYNMTDIAAAMGLVQLRKLESMWARRREIAETYSAAFGACAELEIPCEQPSTRHAWQLYPLRLRLERLKIDRAAFVHELSERGIGTSVHFIPLHIHPYYRSLYGFSPSDFPVAYGEYLREISLPIYSRMAASDIDSVKHAVLDAATTHRLD